MKTLLLLAIFIANLAYGQSHTLPKNCSSVESRHVVKDFRFHTPYIVSAVYRDLLNYTHLPIILYCGLNDVSNPVRNVTFLACSGFNSHSKERVRLRIHKGNNEKPILGILESYTDEIPSNINTLVTLICEE